MATSGGKPAVAPGGASAANILDGFSLVTATQAATTFLTVPAGRTWVGTVEILADVANAGANAVAGVAQGIVSVAGAGAAPPAGNIMACTARAGANVAAGTVGSQGSNNSGPQPLTIVAPGGNAVTLQLTTTVAGTNGEVSVSAIGSLQ